MTVVPMPMPVMMTPAPVVTMVPTPMAVMPVMTPAHLFRLELIDLVALTGKPLLLQCCAILEVCRRLQVGA